MTYQKPKGTRDLFGFELERLETVNSIARKYFKKSGYQEIKIPTFEFATLFSRSIGETTDIVEKEMYSFEIDERVYVLRPEGTASVLRAFIENKLSLPARFLYIGSMFRKERPQKGRYREFEQIGIELLGESQPFYDAEIIEQAKRFLKNIGAEDFFIEINSIGCPKCRTAYKNILKNYLKPHMNTICNDCQRRFGKNFLRIFDCKRETCQKIYDTAPMITDHLCSECREHYTRVKKYLSILKVDTIENKKLVRGLDYYTRTVFEFKQTGLGAQDTIIAGGRYDLLMKELGGGDVPCLGWAMGPERMLLTLPENVPQLEGRTSIYIAVIGERYLETMLTVRDTLIKNDFICIMAAPDDSVKHQLKKANRLKVDYVILYGEDEAEKNFCTLKHMKSGEQKSVLLGELVTSIRSI
jgi:histidyl-tRNA synthetase